MKKIFRLFIALALFGLSAGVANAQTWEIGYPNPSDVTATLNAIRIESGISMKSVEVYNALGQAIRLVRPDSNRAQIDNLPSGVLVVKVSLQSGKVEIKKIGKR